MHRAISGDLQNEEEMERAMEEAGEEAIYQVQNNVGNDTVHSYSHSAAPLLWPPLFVLLIKKIFSEWRLFFLAFHPLETFLKSSQMTSTFR